MKLTKLVFYASLLAVLLAATGCSTVTDVFKSDEVSGQVILANRPVPEEFIQSSMESSGADITSSKTVDSKKIREQIATREQKLVVEFASESAAKNILEEYSYLKQKGNLNHSSTYLLEIKEKELETAKNELRSNSQVEYIEETKPYFAITTHPDNADQYWEKQWHYPAVSLPEAWSVTEASSAENPEVTVAVLDTGIDATHSEFGDNIKGLKSFIDDQDAVDKRGHGTHVAGNIGAANNQQQVVGVDWEVNLLGAKVLSDDTGAGNNFDIAEAIEWAVDEGADIINLSLAGPVPSRTIKKAVNYANQKNVTIIAGVGNEGNGTIDYPARYEQVISVGALEPSLEATDYSNRGQNIDFVAPGTPVYSTMSDENVYSADFIDEIDGQKYGLLGGTSMSTPHVSGLASLLIRQGIAETPAAIKKQLKQTAQDLGAQNAGNQGWDGTYGYGLVNSYAAISGTEITEAKVFAGKKDGDIIQQVGDMVNAKGEGFYELELAEDDLALFAWIDVTDSGMIEAGDYFAASGELVEGGVNKTLTLELVTEEVGPIEIN